MLSLLQQLEPSSRPVPKAPSAILAAWEAGELSWLLRPHQLDVYEDMRAKLWGGDYCKSKGTERRYILKCHRRYGKSFECGVIAFELCLQKAGACVYWAAETSKQVRKITRSVLKPLLRRCPEHLRPAWNSQDGFYRFPNGSEIHIAGCEDEEKADRLRGDGCDLFIIDEAGSLTTLRYVYRSIALWMVADRGGRIIMASSPAKTPAHEFTRYAKIAESGISEVVVAEGATEYETRTVTYVGSGGYAHRTVHDSKWNEALLAELAVECGGVDTVEWQREALAMDVVDERRAIMGADYVNAESTIVGEWERPRYFIPFVAMDLGFHPDLTFATFGYYDFKNDWDVFEDEVVISQMTTDTLANALKEKEAELWSDYFAQLEEERHLFDNVVLEPQRYCDTEFQVIADLSVLHELSFAPVDKHDKQAWINYMRVRVKTHRTRIHKRCKQLRAHLAAGIWNAKHSSYERVDGFGHFDGCDAAIYFTRMLDRHSNPYPRLLPEEAANPMRVARAGQQGDSLGESLSKMFRPLGME